jgi:hypothetical protein
MVFSFSSTASSTPNCSSSNEALLQILFNNASGSDTAIMQEGGMSVALIVPSNGTTIDSVQFNKGDNLANLSMCVPASLCYGLELINFWKDYYQIFYDKSELTDAAQQFPYYMRPPQLNNASAETSSTFTPFESNLTFVEIGQGSSCVPECDPTTEALYEVQIFGGNNGEASLSWRIEQQQDEDTQGGNPQNYTRYMGCEDDPAGDTCGNSYDVRVSRSCLPASTSAQNCLRFVMGNPNVVPSEGPDAFSDVDSATGGGVPPSIQGAGHYHPTFQVSVNGTVVAQGTSPTFTSVEIMGAACSRCPEDTALLEIFQYRTGPVDYSLRDLQSGQLVSRSSVNSSDMLRYERTCVSSSSCYALAFESSDAPFNAPLSIPVTDGVSTQVILDGVYFTNALVRDVPFRAILGNDCAQQPSTACSANETLVSVAINTTGTGSGGGTGTSLNNGSSLYLPSYYCAWSIFDLNDPPKQRLPELSTRYFANGYPSGCTFRHSLCVPDNSNNNNNSNASSSDLVLGMLSSVPTDVVSWAVQVNGNAPLECRMVTDGNHPDDYWSDYIRTPLDGSCQASVGDPGGLSPTLKFAIGLSVGIFVPVLMLSIAVFFFSFGEDRRSISDRLRRRNSASISSLSSDSPGMTYESDSVDYDCGPWRSDLVP